ncbi:hypothetical protein AAG570_013948 [Ranatra chinensis]|uniref:15-hydroxyprostaglandin dehydrogenase [NAD(+)] n=1 Tax=Ranatra chinensis TaxID=642074 RepID=A0ABD0YDM8_9HEMI
MKYMSKVNGGRGGIIINTASITSETPFPTIPIYAATKAAVSHFSRSFGDPLYSGKSGVKVIAINPGLTDTQILKNIADYSLYDPDVKVAFDVMRTKVPTQKVNNMGVGLLQVLEKAESGSVWTIENDQPAKRCLNPA